jgi:hypothetical protein
LLVLTGLPTWIAHLDMTLMTARRFFEDFLLTGSAFWFLDNYMGGQNERDDLDQSRSHRLHCDFAGVLVFRCLL